MNSGRIVRRVDDALVGTVGRPAMRGKLLAVPPQHDLRGVHAHRHRAADVRHGHGADVAEDVDDRLARDLPAERQPVVAQVRRHGITDSPLGPKPRQRGLIRRRGGLPVGLLLPGGNAGRPASPYYC